MFNSICIHIYKLLIWTDMHLLALVVSEIVKFLGLHFKKNLYISRKVHLGCSTKTHTSK